MVKRVTLRLCVPFPLIKVLNDIFMKTELKHRFRCGSILVQPLILGTVKHFLHTYRIVSWIIWCSPQFRSYLKDRGDDLRSVMTLLITATQMSLSNSSFICHI